MPNKILGPLILILIATPFIMGWLSRMIWRYVQVEFNGFTRSFVFLFSSFLLIFLAEILLLIQLLIFKVYSIQYYFIVAVLGLFGHIGLVYSTVLIDSHFLRLTMEERKGTDASRSVSSSNS